MVSGTLPTWDAIVVGGGHNGLVCAAYLARGGLRTLVLERRETVGGAAATAELEPGVRIPLVADTVGRLRPAIARDLRLHDHGLRLIAPAVRAFAPQPDGRAVTLWADVERTARDLGEWSAADAAAYPVFDARVRVFGRFLAGFGDTTPPDLHAPGLADALAGLRLGRAWRGLGTVDGRALLRALPMAVADFVGEAFESEAVRATLATRGVRYAALGPWSAGSTAHLLTDSAAPGAGAAGQTVFAVGGPGALADALAAAARAAGATIRTGEGVRRVATLDGRVQGVVLASGEEVAAPIVVSALDPKRTLLGLLDPVELGPTMVWRAGNLRLGGVVAKVDLALAGLPHFPAAGEGPTAERRLRGRILVGATSIDDLERAFDASTVGRLSDAPFLEATIPSLADPSLVVGAREPRHVMSVLVQWAPYHRREGDWDADRKRLGDLVLARLDEVAPGIGALVTARRVLTPLDLEREFGMTEGHPLHGEPGLDQWFAWRPMAGLGRYRLPVGGLYLAGSGAHPGGGITGAPGANAAREVLADRRAGLP
ncbi:MAG TPA: NAD(P)/FAD-dependent oxidoreductase [Candidatus Limnocylindrales bacterium]